MNTQKLEKPGDIIKRLSHGEKGMDAIKYLRSEHSKFRKTLTAINKISDEKSQKRKFKVFCKELVRHETMEQKAWYPILRKDLELKEIIRHLVAEEKKAAKAIKKLTTSKTSFKLIWKLKFLKFKHDVDHHAKDEEKKLFPQVRKLFSKTQLNTLGVKMRKFKSTLK